MKHAIIAAIISLTVLAANAQPSANEIVFQSFTPGMRSQIYSIRADGSGQVNLSNDPTASYSHPSWSPNGTKIVYVKDGRIWVMNADGTNRINLTVAGVEGRSYPVWSPDGSKIAYVFDGHGFEPPSINVINTDGSNQRQLTFIGDDYSPGLDWSPDGTRIVFSRYDSAGKNLYVMNADGTGQTVITPNHYDPTNPKWSPDGSKIAFWSCAACGFYFAQIYTISPDGTGLGAFDYADWDDAYPAWSPDGTKVVFSSNRDSSNGSYNIYVMNADGTNTVRLTQNAFNSIAPNWKRVTLFQLSGRVTTSSQRGIPRARITLDDGAGNARFAITNPFGYFRFFGVPTGTYAVSVGSKRYSFPSRTISVSASFTGLDFVAVENP